MGYSLISKGNVIIDNVALVKGLEHNLLSICQLCDRGHQVWFSNEARVVSDKKDNKVVLTENRKGNVYITDFISTNAESITCLFTKVSLDCRNNRTFALRFMILVKSSNRILTLIATAQAIQIHVFYCIP